jgi:hypothetical protein
MRRRQVRRHLPRVTPTGVGAIGAVARAQCGVIVLLRTVDERSLIQLLEPNDAILTNEQEPHASDYELQGRRYTFTPPFLAQHRDERLVLLTNATDEWRAFTRCAAEMTAAQRHCTSRDQRLVALTGQGRTPLPPPQRDNAPPRRQVPGDAVIADLFR